MEWLFEPNALVALLTLTALEVVLGIDNLVVISLLTSKLPAAQQKSARTIGLGLALGVRVLLLFSISWIMGLTADLFSVLSQGISGRDLILILGGIFLVYKAVHEIHEKLEGGDDHAGDSPKHVSYAGVLTQIILFDLVFSLDSVITAIGMAEDIRVMIAAVVIAIVVMMISVNGISNFVHRHPTVQMLAFSFLLLIGVTLVAEGFEQHVSKGYIYSAMAFSVFVEVLNLRSSKKKKAQPVELHHPHFPEAELGNVAGAKVYGEKG